MSLAPGPHFVVDCLSGSLFGAPAGKLVGPFVLGVSRMTLEPKPLHLVAAQGPGHSRMLRRR